MRISETSEKVFERTASKYVETVGGVAVKLLSQFINGLPDRLFLLPHGRVIFVEFKSTGCKPRKIQEVVMRRISDLGFTVLVVGTVNEYEELIRLIDDIVKSG